MRDRPVLVTGGTGFLGSRIARALLDRGERVRLLHRPGRAPALEAAVPEESTARAEPVEGDLRDAASLERAVRGSRAVVHAAARVSRSGRREEFDAVNVDGLARLLAASRAAGVRLVYTSSFFALGPSLDGQPLSERSLDVAAPELDAYQASKRRAALLARDAAREGGDVVTLHAGTLVGPGPLTEGNFVTAMVRDHLAGRIVPLPDGGRHLWSFVHVDDVAACHVTSLDRPEAHGDYVVGGDNATLRELFARVADWTGRPPPRLSVPHAITWLAGAAEELLHALFGRPPTKLTRGAARLLRHDWPLDSTRAREGLGHRPRPLARLAHDTIRWLVDEGLVPPEVPCAPRTPTR